MCNSYPYNSVRVYPEETFILNASISRVRDVNAGNNYFICRITRTDKSTNNCYFISDQQS